jgi:hypothetical protein
VTALSLTAVGGTGGETSLQRLVSLLICPTRGAYDVTYVALAADHLLAVELGGKSLQGGLDDTTTETEDQVESGLLLYRSACDPKLRRSS